MAEERKERCAGCGREFSDNEEKVVYVPRLIVSLGKLMEIKMWVNNTERNLTAERDLTAENTFLCVGNPECGASWIKKQLAGIR